MQTCHASQRERVTKKGGLFFSPDIRLKHQQPWLGITLPPPPPPHGSLRWWDSPTLLPPGVLLDGTPVCWPIAALPQKEEEHHSKASSGPLVDCASMCGRVTRVHWVSARQWWLSKTYHLQSERPGRRWNRLFVEGGQQQLHLLDLSNADRKWIDLWLTLWREKKRLLMWCPTCPFVM